MKSFKRFFFLFFAVVLAYGLVFSGTSGATTDKRLTVGSATANNTGDATSRTVSLPITLKGGNSINGLAFTLKYDSNIFDFAGLTSSAKTIDDGSSYDPNSPPTPETIKANLYYQANGSNPGRVLVAAAAAEYLVASGDADIVPFNARFTVKPGMGSGTYPIGLLQTIIGPDTAANAGYTTPTPIPVAVGLAPDADPSLATSYIVELVAGSITIGGGYTISGTVVYNGGGLNGQPVKLAEVKLYKKSDTNFFQNAITATNNTGAFSFTSKPNGTYKIEVNINTPGYQRKYVGPEFLVEGNVTRPVISMAAYSPISGRVLVDSANKPVPGVKVNVTDNSSVNITVPVDTTGSFVTAPLPAGTYTVTAQYGNQTSLITKNEQTGTYDLNNWALNLGSLSGTISGLAAGQSVMLHLSSATTGLEMIRFLAGDGTYLFDNLLPGNDYIVAIIGDNIPLSYYDGVTDTGTSDIASASLQAITENTETQNINFTFSTVIYNSISGTILLGSTGVSYVPVLAIETTSNLTYFTVSNTDGSYSFDAVADGSYKVKALKRNGKVFYYTDATGSTQVESEASAVTVSGTDATDKNIELDEASCSIKGQVTYKREGGDPVAGILVIGLSSQGGSMAVTDKQGGYSLTGLACSTSYAVTIYPNKPYPPATATVTTSTNGESTKNFVIQTGWAFSGTVHYDDGNTDTKISGAYVLLVKSNGMLQGIPVLTNTAGAFSMADIPSGVYTLNVRHPDYKNKEVADFVIDGDKTGYDVIMEPGGTIQGTVSDSSGALGGVVIKAHAIGDPPRFTESSSSDSNKGTYKLSGLKSATSYNMTFTKKDYLRHIETVTAPATLDVTMEKPAASWNYGGYVELGSGGSKIQNAIVIMSSASKNFFKNTVTDSNGAFSFTNLPASNDYKLAVVPGNDKPTYIEENIVLNGDVTGKVVTIPDNTITGNITLFDGETSKTITVYLRSVTKGKIIADVVASHTGGGVYSYTFNGVASGEDYNVAAFEDEYGLEWYVDGSNGGAFEVKGTVQAGGSANITMTK